MLFLRDTPVDVLRYLPDFLAEDMAFKNVQDGLSKEHEQFRLRLAKLADQLFIPTAGEIGISSWERVIGLIPKVDAGLEARRRAVLLWLQANSVSTKEFMLNLIKRYYAKEASVKLDEHNEEYYFSITSNKFPDDLQGLTAAIEMYKPAHLGYEFNAVLNDVNENGEIDMASGISEYHGIFKSVLGHKYIEYDSSGFDAECSGLLRHGIASVRHGNKTLGGNTDIVQDNSLGMYVLHNIYGSRIIEAEYPDDLPVPKHEFHFNGRGRLYDGVMHIAKGYRVIGAEMPKNLPPKPTEFILTDIGAMSHGLVHCVSGIRIVEAEPAKAIRPDIGIRVELEAGLHAAAIYARRGLKAIDTERVHMPLEPDIDISGNIAEYAGAASWKTGSVTMSLEAAVEDAVLEKGHAAAVSILTGSMYLNVGNINEGDETRLTAGSIASTTGSRNINLAIDAPKDIFVEVGAAICTITNGSRLAGLPKVADVRNASNFASLNAIGGSRDIAATADRHSVYVSGESIAAHFRHGSAICISKHYAMPVVDGHQDIEYTQGAAANCNIKAGAAVSVYKNYIINCNEEDND